MEAPAHSQLFSCQLQFPIPVTTGLQRSPWATPISPSLCAPATRSGYQLWWLLTCVVLAKPSPKSQNTASASRIGNLALLCPGQMVLSFWKLSRPWIDSCYSPPMCLVGSLNLLLDFLRGPLFQSLLSFPLCPAHVPLLAVCLRQLS